MASNDRSQPQLSSEDHSYSSLAPRPSDSASNFEFIENDMRELNISAEEKPEVILHHWLSTKSVLSTASSTALAAERTGDTLLFVQIGFGFCGEVWNDHGKYLALKRAWVKAEQQAELRNDAEWRVKICKSFADIETGCHVPQFLELVDVMDDWWVKQGQRMPKSQDPRARGSNERTPVLISEHIPPLPQKVRSAIIDVFCPEPRKDIARADPKNRDCLARIYLGLRSPPNGQEYQNQVFTLRNFPLSLDKIERLGLDRMLLAGTIARALATMHWSVGTDARDVEFVLGMTPEVNDIKMGTTGNIEDTDLAKFQRANIDFKRRAVYVWLLDFNQCGPITMDENGCIKSAEAFLQNDPYYPRLSTPSDNELWKFFVDEYVSFGKNILAQKYPGQKEMQDLPMCFVEKVIEMVQAQKTISKAMPIAGPPKGAGPAPKKKKSGSSRSSRGGKSVDLGALLE